MHTEIAAPDTAGFSPSRRQLLATTGALFAAADVGVGPAAAQPVRNTDPAATGARQPNGALHRQKLVGLMLGHEQFTVPQLVDIGKTAAQAGFNLLATSDHFQPWQANEGHCGEAWVTLGALGERAQSGWMGATVTCPAERYPPAVVAQTFASLALLYPGRVFLGVGSGEALNEQAATGAWPAWPERWERLAEAHQIIRALSRGAARSAPRGVEGRAGQASGQVLPGRRQALRPAAAADPAVDRGQRQEIDAARRHPRRRADHRSDDLEAAQGGMGSRRARGRQGPRTDAGAGRAVCRRRRQKRGRARRRAVALHSEGVQEILQCRRPGGDPEPSRERPAARQGLRGLAGRHRPPAAYR